MIPIPDALNNGNQNQSLSKEYKILIENTPDIITHFDHDLRLLFINSRAEEELGIKKDEDIGKTIREVGLNETFIITIEKYLKLTIETNQKQTIEFEYSNLRGKNYYQTIIVPEFNQENLVSTLICITRNITDRKLMEDRLRESEDRFRLLYENAPLGYQSLDSKGNFIEVNQAWLDTLGYTREEVIGKWFGYFLAPEYVQAFRERFPIFIAQGKIHSEFYMLHKSGNKRYITFEGRIGKNLDNTFRQTHCILNDITEQKKEQNKIQENYQIFQSILQTTQDGFAIADNKGHFQDVNERFLRMTGYTREEILDFSIKDIDINENEEEIFQRMKKIITKGNDIFQTRLKRNNNSIVEVEVSINYLKTQEKFVGFFRDISERNHGITKLNETIQYLQSILQTTQDGFWISDNEGNFIDVNDAYLRMTGYSRSEFLQINVKNIEVEENEEEILKHIKKLHSTGHDFFQSRHYRKDGSIFDVEISTTYLDEQRVFVSFLRDITERNQANLKLQENYNYLQSILQTTQDGFCVLDLKGYIVDINEAFSKMLGYKKNELIGRDLNSIDADENPDQTINHINKIITDKYDLFQTHHKKKDGEIIAVEVSASYSNMNEGRLICFVHDITTRIIEEENKQRLQAQLAQTQKMESIGQLAGGIAHDFNNMLGVIIGYTQLSLQNVDDNNPILPYLKEILKAAKHSAELTEQLLTFARKQPIIPKVLDLNESIKSIYKILTRIIGENIELKLELINDLWQIFIDPSQITQIFVNLCANARDAIKESGKIIIKTENIILDEQFCKFHPDFTTGYYCLISVTDNGCGMDDNTLARLFEPFFTTKELGKGTGLGLSIIYGIIKQNRGNILVESKVGIGTTFRIYFQRHIEKSDSTSIDEEKHVAFKGNETILVVEDEPSILSLVKIILENEGYKVFTALSHNDAIIQSKNYCEDLDLLITDVIMPEINGMVLANNIKTNYCPGIKCLYMSGYSTDIIEHYGVHEKSEYFIRKPFSLTELASKVRKILDQK